MRRTFPFCLLTFAFCILAFGQNTVTVRDILYNADGTSASGRLDITWKAFTTADSKTIPAGKLSRNIQDGAVEIALVPNAGSTPSGTSYTVTYYLQSAISFTEYWTIPATGPVTVAAVRTTPVPVPAVTFGQPQLTIGTGMGVLLGLWRQSTAPTATQAGQCYWDSTAVDTLKCSKADLSFAVPGGGPPGGAAG